MRDEVVAGLFGIGAAVVAGMVTTGGIGYRTRGTLLQEYELLKSMRNDDPLASQLRAKADRRMRRYVVPIWVRVAEASTVERITAVVSWSAVMAAAVVMVIANWGTSRTFPAAI